MQLMTAPPNFDRFLGAADLRIHRLIVGAVYGYWVIHMAWSRTWLLETVDTRLFDAPGFLAAVPDGVIDVLLGQPALIVLVVAIAASSLLVASGAVSGRLLPLLTCALLYLHESIVRGYSGHVNHAELPLLTLTLALALIGTPGRRATDDETIGRFRRSELAALGLTLVVVSHYVATGTARLTKDPLLTFSDELRNYMIGFQISDKAPPSESGVVVPGFVDLLQGLPWWVFAALFTAATVLEIAAFLLLKGGVFAYVIPALLLAFHLTTMFLVGPYFPQSMLLLVLFVIVTRLAADSTRSSSELAT